MALCRLQCLHRGLSGVGNCEKMIGPDGLWESSAKRVFKTIPPTGFEKHIVSRKQRINNCDGSGPFTQNRQREFSMSATARDVMTTDFHTLHPESSITAAVELFEKATASERRIFGMMVVDDAGHLAGMLSMYDILLYIRPKHIHIWGTMEDIDIEGVIAAACEKIKSIRVGDLMSREVITVSPQTHLMMVLDIMIKKHIRRLPVVAAGKILGIVYISDLFHHLLKRLNG
jgi:CBS domain-containing protein